MINIFIAVFLFIILLIYSIFFRINEGFSNKTNQLIVKPRIAVYSYNFGNFRGELNRDLDNFKNYPELDYYLFTDQDDIKSEKWKVVKVKLQPRTKHMNANRVTSKYFKWKHIPKELDGYDYLVHIDAGRMRYLNNFSYDKYLELINTNKNYSFIGRDHPFLKSVYDECKHVLKVKCDYDNNVIRWENKLKKENFKQNIQHIETCFFIRNLKDTELTRNLGKVFDAVMKNELCRDQLVFLYTLQQNNYNKITTVKGFSIK